jgi:hypothetical protein
MGMKKLTSEQYDHVTAALPVGILLLLCLSGYAGTHHMGVLMFLTFFTSLGLLFVFIGMGLNTDLEHPHNPCLVCGRPSTSLGIGDRLGRCKEHRFVV